MFSFLEFIRNHFILHLTKKAEIGNDIFKFNAINKTKILETIPF